jgi:hypothetical protein
MDAAAKETEILVLRYQLAVLHRQVARPHFTWSDRALVAFLAGLVPRERWRSFLVSPETIVDWSPQAGHAASVLAIVACARHIWGNPQAGPETA